MRSSTVPTLETERLRLRRFRRSDIDGYAALHEDPEVLRYLIPKSQPWDRGRSWRHMAFVMGHWQLAGSGSWAVEHRETGAFIGMVGFWEPEGWPDLELSWILARRWWGNGYATEAAQAALAHAFTTWRRDHIISLIVPENRASVRIAEKLGQRLERRTDFFGNEVLCYGIDRESFERLRESDQPEVLLAS